MTEPLWNDDVGPIKDAWKDMPVVDRAGRDVGRVEFVKMGDPEAVTSQGQTGRSEALGGLVRRIVGGEPDAPDQAAEKLLRVGYVKVDGSGVLDGDVYVAADQIAAVVDGRVVLSVDRDGLTSER